MNLDLLPSNIAPQCIALLYILLKNTIALRYTEINPMPCKIFENLRKKRILYSAFSLNLFKKACL